MNTKEEAQQNGFEEMWEKVQEILGEHVKPRIMVGGKTGVGKSSALNALMGKHVYETGVLPTTRTTDESIWETKDGDIVVVEVPGLGEAKAPELEDEGYKEWIKKLAKLKAHLFILILKCDDRALEIVNRYSLACAGAVCANLTPGSDALLIAPIQVAMIIHLGKLHNIDVSTSTASGLLSSIGLTLTGRFIAQEAVSFIPGLKNIVGPPLAFGLTYTLGKVVNGLFAQGKLDATKEDIKECLDKCECEGSFV